MTAWGEFGKRAGALGMTVGAVAAGAAIGLAAERYAVGRSFRRDQGAGDEPFGQLHGQPRYVEAEDGVHLHVEVHEPRRPVSPLTVVFCHGYALTQEAWHFQRKAFGDRLRCVFWDQRSHGRSWNSGAEKANIDQLGRDLRAVLDQVVPDGPIVLVGHSMGGMTVMALADQAPELFGDRILGVALIATSSGRLADVTLGIPAYTAKFLRRFVPGVMQTLRRQSELVEKGRRAGTDLSYVLTKRYSFASDVPTALVQFADQILRSTPIDVVADFYPAFDSHDKLRALPVLANAKTLVIAADKDLLTPMEHSVAIVDAVPGAEFVLVPNAGHLVLLEHPDAVNQHLGDLFDAVAAALPRRRRSIRDRASRSRRLGLAEGPAA